MGAIKLINRTTGKLEDHDSAESDALVTRSGGTLDYPSPAELERGGRLERSGSAASQALAAGEKAVRTATFGAIQGVGTAAEQAERERTLSEESPGVAFGAQALGTVAPAIAGGALAQGAAGALGVGARIAGAAGVAAEGAAGGLADEVEQAQAEGRPVSAGRAMLTGIGGEVLGRALPAALRAGIDRIAPRTAANVVAGEAVADVSKAAGKKARAQLVEDAYHMPPGRARDEALASTANEQLARADAELTKHSARAAEVLGELQSSAVKDVQRHVPPTTPGQVSWAADTAEQLRGMAASAKGAEKQELLKSAKALLDADDSEGIWKATSEARERFKAAKPEPATAAAGDDLESLLSKSVDNAQAKKAGAPAPYQRTPKGARVLDRPVEPGGAAPDFSTWDVTDFAKGRGGSNAMGKGAPDYSGGNSVSAHQRALVDGLKQNAEFRATGKVTGDSGGLKSEPTFVIEPDGSVRMPHGRLRMTAARELDRETVYGRVVSGKGAKAQTLYEGQIRIGGGKPAGTATPAAPAGALSAADELLARGQRDPALFGKAATAADELHTSSSAGPGRESAVAPIEDQLAAAERWRVGSDKARAELRGLTEKMRGAQSLRDDTQRAVASVGATPREPAAPSVKGGKRDLLGAVLREGAEAAVEHVVGGSIPFAGYIAKGLWGALGDAGQAKVSRTVRGLLSPITSSGRILGASRAAAGMTALQRFAGDAPDARSAYEGRREMLSQVTANPKLASDVIANSLQGLAQEHPENFMALARRMTESLQYVAGNLPPTVGVSMAYPTGIPLSDSELRDVADLWNSAMEPETVLDDIERCRANTTQMKTLKEAHGDIYNDVRKEMLLQVADTFQSIPSQTKLSIDIMFGSDGLGGLFASNEAARYITAARNMPKGRKGPAESEARVEKQSESLEAAGPAAVRTGVTNRGTI